MGQFVIFVLTITILIIRLGYAYKVCRTEKCIEIATKFSRVMNPSIDPCDDFYGYMCGNWNKIYPISERDTERLINSHTVLHINMDLQKLDILTKKLIAASSKALKTARELFKSCMNVKKIDNDEAKNLLASLNRMGEWLLLTPEPVFGLKNFWQKYLKMEYQFITDNPFFKLTIGQHPMRSNIPLIILQKPTVFLSRTVEMNDLVKTEVIKAYKDYIRDVATYLRKNSGKRDVLPGMDKDIDEMIEFELSLTMLPPNKREIMTIDQFQDLYNRIGGDHPNAQIDWLSAIQFLFAQAKIKITKSQQVLVLHLEHFEHLPEILKATKSRTIANYIVWTFVRNSIKFSGKGLMSISKQFNDKIHRSGQAEFNRVVTCFTHPTLDKAISLEYVKRYFIESNKNEAQRIINHMFQVYKDALSKTDWMDQESRKISIDKLQSILTLLAYPENFTSTTIDKYYKNFKLGSNYLESMINIEKFNYLNDLSKMGRIIDRTQWEVEPTMTDAFYNTRSNSITIPAAFLQHPIIDPDRPQVLNYAVFGFIIAHEISHAFDPTGVRCNKEGKIVNLWPPHTHKIYKGKTDFVIDQYNQYPVPGLYKQRNAVYTRGEQTVTENVADLIGLQKAYDAYVDYLRMSGGEDMRLPGFENTTSHRLFFMFHALFRCVSMTTMNRVCIHDTDCHALPEVRLRGAISNHKGFGHVFGCEPGSRMNPLEKCSMFA
ncbi:neprilysin-11-like isoform X1 [Prorops nasuta]|uniref:neprilysin-11-like isoform X1 n=3 Tax=Prorops nasuta TaxID=863751 RepID=UPI0034CECB42